MCRVYFELSKQRQEIDPAHGDCPIECLHSRKKYDFCRTVQCEECPHRLAAKSFKNQFEEIILVEFGEEISKKFKFESLVLILNQTISLEDLPARQMTAKTEAILGIYRKEKYRHEKIEMLEAQEKPKS